MRDLFLATCLLLAPALASQAAQTSKLATQWALAEPLASASQLQSSLADRRESLGGFLFQWDAAAQRFSISPSAGGRAIWANVPEAPFVLAGRGEEDVSQWRGSFTFRDSPAGLRCYRQSLDFWQADATTKRLVLGGRLEGEGCNVSYQLSFRVENLQRLSFDLSFYKDSGEKIGEETINRSALLYASRAEEHFYGFGEQFTYFDLKGRVVPIFAQEQGHLRGSWKNITSLVNVISPGAAGAWHTTYTAMPVTLTSDERGLIVDQPEYLYFDLEEDDRVEVRAWSSSLKGYLLSGKTPLSLIEALTEVTGRMPRLPDWFHRGAIVGIMGGEEAVARVHSELKERETPIAAYWLQDWVGKRWTPLGTRMWWNWELDRASYPNWETMSASLRGEGIRVLGYINPFLSDASSKDGVRRNLFAEARDRGYLVRNQKGKPYEIDSGGFGGTLFDFSNAEGRAWLKDYLKQELFARGFSGWMADFGEALPFDAQTAGSEAPSRYHHGYIGEWARFNREIIEEAGLQDEAVFFVRNAVLRSPGTTNMFWLGDQMTMWDEYDGFKSSITGLLSGGVSGLALNHGDIGGLIAFNPVGIRRDAELLKRWTEMSAFTAAFRTHEGNDPGASHQFYDDIPSLDHFAYFAKVFAQLFSYRRTLIEEATRSGHPVVRHPWLHYPQDPVVHGLRFQFMLGPDFMVAPSTEAGASETQIYLPRGSWVHLWSGRSLELTEGRWVATPSPIGFPAVYFRSDSAAAWDAYQKIKDVKR